MNTTLTTDRRQENQITRRPQPARRLTLVDRAALHIGMLLIRWSRRPGLPRDERRASVQEHVLLHREYLRVQRAVERDRTRGRAEHDLLLVHPR